MHATRITHFSVAEYLTRENDGEQRHEYLDGEIVAMTGASEAHNVIAGNLFTAFRTHLRGTPCRAYMGDMKLQVEAANCFFYPDVLIHCGDEPARTDRYALDDACLLVEVLSASTESRDREFKRLAYQHVPGLQDYVLVQQAQRLVTVYRRMPDGWEKRVYGAAEAVELSSIDLTLPMAAIYEDVALGAGA